MPKAKPGETLTFDSPRAATVQVEYTMRAMKFYHVAQNEMDSLSLLNDFQSGLLGAAVLCLGVAVPESYSAIWGPVAAGDGKKALTFWVLGVVCLVLAALLRKRASGIWAMIGRETQNVQNPAK